MHDLIRRIILSSLESELSSSSVYLAGYSYNNVADCQIEFYIKDFATDVRRKNNTTTPSFGTNDAVKKTAQGGLDPKDPTTKLNIWVCDLGSGLLGYAQFPGEPPATDGVVLKYSSIGSMLLHGTLAHSNLGRTATHEVGHWVGFGHEDNVSTCLDLTLTRSLQERPEVCYVNCQAKNSVD